MLLYKWDSNNNCDHLTGGVMSRYLFERVLRWGETAVADMNSSSPELDRVCGSAGFGL